MAQTIGNHIRLLRTERNKTQEELGKALGVGNTTISQYESGARKPDADTILRLADYFRVSTDCLLGRAATEFVNLACHGRSITIPILGRIKAGIPILAEENWEGEVEIPSDIKADFALRISGDSMSWAGIAEGDIAVLRKTDNPPNGAIVAAVIEEATWEATLKFFVRENGGAVLKAANPEYKDIPAGPKLKIIGQLVTLLKNPPTVSNYLAHLVHKDISDRKWQYAIELATQAGLDGESVANLINMVAKSARQLIK
ncbi:MAG: helix-turn-helix domain-containing protein [Peptococcaceae bacterium]|nr:helix-turn-helix domain-containing protein [Peptococcaceae bacterium]